MDFQRPENGAKRVTSATMMMMMTDRATGEDEAFGDEEPVVDADEKKQRRLVTPAAAGGGGRRLSGGTFCQAEKCGADIMEAKRYHRRHKVCEFHAKAPSVLVAGLRQRFCQQCSRFHELLEFDEAKRSCRTRLAGHNERRRKSTSEPQQGEPSSASTSMGRPKVPNGPSPQQPQCRPADHERASRVMSCPPGNPSAYKHFHIR